MTTSPGRGAIAPDGSPVELYLLLPHLGEADIVHAAIPEKAPILELGCGVGRVTHELVRLGHPVCAVDESPDMLERVVGAERICSSIGGLALGRTFPVVLLASHLINTADDAQRHQLLAAVERHLDSDGVLLVEWHPPAWFTSVRDGDGGTVGPLDVQITDVHRDADLLSATVRYRTKRDSWTHPFAARRLTDDRLDTELAGQGLRRLRWVTEDHTWFAASHA